MQSKYIAKIKERTQRKIDALRAEANDAYNSWADTGYQRYMTKKERLETEADELEAFIHPEHEVREERAKTNLIKQENERLILLLKSVKNVVEEEMLYDFPDAHATRRLEEIVNKFKFEHLSKRG